VQVAPEAAPEQVEPVQVELPAHVVVLLSHFSPAYLLRVCVPQLKVVGLGFVKIPSSTGQVSEPVHVCPVKVTPVEETLRFPQAGFVKLPHETLAQVLLLVMGSEPRSGYKVYLTQSSVFLKR